MVFQLKSATVSKTVSLANNANFPKVQSISLPRITSFHVSAHAIHLHLFYRSRISSDKDTSPL